MRFNSGRYKKLFQNKLFKTISINIIKRKNPKHKIWNVDICDVDPLEYNVKVYDYVSFQVPHFYVNDDIKDDHKSLAKSRYGPKKGLCIDAKFMIDFAKCFDEIRKGPSDNKKFDLLITVNEYSEKTI